MIPQYFSFTSVVRCLSTLLNLMKNVGTQKFHSILISLRLRVVFHNTAIPYEKRWNTNEIPDLKGDSLVYHFYFVCVLSFTNAKPYERYKNTNKNLNFKGDFTSKTIYTLCKSTPEKSKTIPMFWSMNRE